MHKDSFEGKWKQVTRSVIVATLVALGTGCAATADRESVGEYADNSVVTTKVKTALARTDIATLLDVEVQTYRGVVQLSGFVDDETQKLRAGEVALEIGGVKRVENSLVVKPAS